MNDHPQLGCAAVGKNTSCWGWLQPQLVNWGAQLTRTHLPTVQDTALTWPGQTEEQLAEFKVGSRWAGLRLHPAVFNSVARIGSPAWLVEKCRVNVSGESLGLTARRQHNLSAQHDD